MPIRFWWAEAQGRRESMEDEHIHYRCDKSGWVIFAVCDGHGGTQVVKRLAAQLGLALYKNLCKLSSSNPKRILLRKEVYKTMHDTIVNLDREMEKTIKGRGRDSGSTVVAIAFNRFTRQLIILSVGDSRCVCRSDVQTMKFFATSDHKPDDKVELKRIQQAGSFVKGKRVGGVLAMSRAMGDFPLKATKTLAYDPVHGAVSASPTVKVGGLSKAAGCTVLLACDGVFDVMTNEQAIDFAQKHIPLEKSTKANNPAKMLVEEALKRGTTDNVTAFLVRID